MALAMNYGGKIASVKSRAKYSGELNSTNTTVTLYLPAGHTYFLSICTRSTSSGSNAHQTAIQISTPAEVAYGTAACTYVNLGSNGTARHTLACATDSSIVLTLSNTSYFVQYSFTEIM